jgi:hypothetical protein
MWDRLSVPVEYRARFVEKHPTLTQVIFALPRRSRPLSFCLSQEVLDAYEDEVRRQRHHIKGQRPVTVCSVYLKRSRVESRRSGYQCGTHPHRDGVAGAERQAAGERLSHRCAGGAWSRRRSGGPRAHVGGESQVAGDCSASQRTLFVTVKRRLEARVAASRRILALAKRREDVGHRLKLFESGDEERRNSGAGVQLQVCLFQLIFTFECDFLVPCFLNDTHVALQEERLRRTLQRELPRITDELRALLEQVLVLRVVQCCVWGLILRCSGRPAKNRVLCSTAFRCCNL